MTNGRATDMVLEATTSFILFGAILACVLVAYGLLIATELLPGWLTSASAGVATF